MKTKPNRWTYMAIFAVATLALVAFASFALTAYTHSPEFLSTRALTNYSTARIQLAEYGISDKFDRATCELNCRSAYRYDWSTNTSLYYGCIQRCTDKAWQDFYGNKKTDANTAR